MEWQYFGPEWSGLRASGITEYPSGMPEGLTSFGISNGIFYAVAGLLLFFGTLAIARKRLEARDLNQAIVSAAIILGAAIIIALTMH